MNVVSIMAHQDDEMGCLGTMLKCRARGDSLHFITLTDGSKGFVQKPGIAVAEAARMRHQEMASLASSVGATYTNLAQPDEFLYDTAELRMMLIEAIRSRRADLIFTHFSDDYNQDHVTACALVRHCAMQSCLPVLPTESPPLPEHPAVFMIEPHGPFAFIPTQYVDISDVHDRKASLLCSHASQEEAMKAAVGTGLGAYCSVASRFRGQQVGCTHAEAFIAMQARGSIKTRPVLP